MLCSDDQPQLTFPWATIGLIGFCVAVFIWQYLIAHQGGQNVTIGYGCIPAVVLGHAQYPAGLPHPPALLTLLTSAFLHGGLAHLLGNMLFLWIFGANVEDSFDWPIYLAFVVICAISANLAEVAMDAHSLTPRIGASGFISGIMGSYLILFPKAKLKYIVFLPVAGFQTFKMPAWLALTFWIGTQVYSLRHAAPEAAGGVAFLSHIAGFGMGACLGWLLWYFGIAATYAEGMTEPD